MFMEADLMVHSCNLNTREAEAEGLKIWGQSGPHNNKQTNKQTKRYVQGFLRMKNYKLTNFSQHRMMNKLSDIQSIEW
jgi:hypothetical protein